MSTAVFDVDSVIEVEPGLKRKAGVVLEQLGMSLTSTVNLLLDHVAVRRRLPDDLSRPPIPCLDEMTEEEFDAMIQESFRAIDEGRTYTVEEVRKMLEADYEAL